jgi:MoaA/NifB/PqqE/SkfB family radical SAM enzyme
MKLSSTVLGLLKSKFTSRPFYARYHITHRCNYRCSMCGQRTDAADPPELSTREAAAVADILSSLGVRHAVITGGEPFLREDLADVISLFADRSFSVRVQTNGGPQVTREAVSRCAAAGLQDLSVSIDTLRGEVQDRICGVKDAVDHALNALSLAREMLPSSMSLANVVASKHNFEELPSIVRFFHARSTYTYITPVMIRRTGEAGAEYRFRTDDETFSLEGMESGKIRAVIGELIELRRRSMGLTNSTLFLEDFHRYLSSGRCAWKCEAGNLYLDVFPDGGVSVCKEKSPLCNILDPGFRDYFSSGKFHERADEVASSCTGCFYGEYREPQYALRNLSTFAEWVHGWAATFRHGMEFTGTGK